MLITDHVAVGAKKNKTLGLLKRMDVVMAYTETKKRRVSARTVQSPKHLL